MSLVSIKKNHIFNTLYNFLLHINIDSKIEFQTSYVTDQHLYVFSTSWKIHWKSIIHIAIFWCETFYQFHICKHLAEQNMCNNFLLLDRRNNFDSSQMKTKHKRFGRVLENAREYTYLNIVASFPTSIVYISNSRTNFFLYCSSRSIHNETCWTLEMWSTSSNSFCGTHYYRKRR